MNASRYRLNAHKLEQAVNEAGKPATGPVTLDRIRAREPVWAHCRNHANSFLEALEELGAHPDDAPITSDGQELAAAIGEVEDWETADVEKLVALSAPDVAVDVGEHIPTDRWPVLAAQNRLSLTVENFAEYAEQWGVDEPLSTILKGRLAGLPGDSPLLSRRDVYADQEQEGAPDTDAKIVNLAVAVVNAARKLPNARERA